MLRISLHDASHQTNLCKCHCDYDLIFEHLLMMRQYTKIDHKLSLIMMGIS